MTQEEKSEDLQRLFRGRLDELRKSFDRIVREFEANRYQSALRDAYELTPVIENLMQTLSEHYATGLRIRMNGLESLQQRLRELSDGKILDQDAAIRVLLDLEKTILKLDKEIRFQYSSPILAPIAKFLRAYWKKAVGLGACAVVLVLIVAGLNAFRMRKYGLVGEYYSGLGFDRFVKKRLDHQIKFDWVKRAPMMGIPRDNFTVCWTGYLRVPIAGTYEFLAESDDGVRLWIDDQKIIDHWLVQPYRPSRGAVRLEEGNHRIRMEYFEKGNLAAVALSWRFESDQAILKIPYKNLVPSDKYL